VKWIYKRFHNDGNAEFDFPQGLKPKVYKVLSGTAEAVPFHNRFMKPALG